MACALSGSSQVPNASTRCGSAAAGHQRGVAEDVGLVVGRRPGHQDLRLRQQQRVEAVAFGLAARRSGRAARSPPRRRAPRAHQHDRGDDGEQQHAEREHERCDLVPVECREGVDIGVERRQCRRARRAPAPPRRQSVAAATTASESASPRMSAASPAVARIVSGMPDCPCAGGDPPLPPANHWDFTRNENRAERVQTVNGGDGGAVLRRAAGRSASSDRPRSGSARRTSSSRLMRLSAAENARSACADRGNDHVVEQRGTGLRGLAAVLDRAGGAQDFVGGDAPALARQLVAAARPADALEDAHRAPAPAAPAPDGAPAARGAPPAPWPTPAAPGHGARRR